jgi:putative ABC transport system permease protein
MDRDQPLYAIETMDAVVANSMAEPRFRTILFGLFGVLAVLLAAVGIYGVISYSASQRTREIGIRMALGAKPGDIFKAVIAQGMLLVVIGIAIGCAVAIWLTNLIRGLLFGITPTDITAFAITAAVLLAVALVASWLPAQRAMKIDPLLAIRNE